MKKLPPLLLVSLLPFAAHATSPQERIAQHDALADELVGLPGAQELYAAYEEVSQQLATCDPDESNAATLLKEKLLEGANVSVEGDNGFTFVEIVVPGPGGDELQLQLSQSPDGSAYAMYFENGELVRSVEAAGILSSDFALVGRAPESPNVNNPIFAMMTLDAADIIGGVRDFNTGRPPSVPACHSCCRVGYGLASLLVAGATVACCVGTGGGVCAACGIVGGNGAIEAGKCATVSASTCCPPKSGW